LDDKELSHYGTPRHSGRYPWGSGEDPEQRNKSFLGQVEELKKKGLSEKEIAEGLGMNTSQLRAKKSLAKAEQRKADYAQAIKWKEKGMSNVEIGQRLGGLNESSVRALLNPAIKERSELANVTANMIKDNVAKKEYVDVGIGVERHLNVSRTKLKTALSQLEEEGYLLSYVPVEQLGTGKKTSMMIISKPKNEDAVNAIKLGLNTSIKKLRDDGYSDEEISKKIGKDVSSIDKIMKEAYADVYANKDKIKTITDYSEDGGRSYLGLEPIRSVDSKRIQVRHHEEGGSDKDGLIELRKGVDDISLGNARYAQVRIGVDGTHYMKGMAVYSNDMPKGVDIIYNTNKKLGAPKDKVFKVMTADLNDPKAKSILSLDISKDEKDNLLKKGVSDGSIKPDPDNPFGASVKQKHYVTDKGAKTPGSTEMLNLKTSGKSYEEISKIMKVPESLVRDSIKIKSVNIVNEEGEWRDKWSKSLSSQMLSKQTPALAKRQLDISYNIKKEEFDEIMSLTNPAVKKRLLESFADDCDSSAVHLKAAALPRAGWHALIPFPNMKETEVYAPNFRDGEKIVLIRYPHGGIFEIPELTVNNKHKLAKEVLKDAKDAIGIHPKVAEKLSGADFDGDSVLAIPNNNRDIKYSASLQGLKDFDPKTRYPAYEGMPKMDARTKGIKMGDVSNLITDMTIRGANNDELARAVRHSMVVIDAEKHNLNYKQSYIDNGIADLKKKYQGSAIAGASTLISRASSEQRVGVRKEHIDPKTGKKVYEYTGETYNKITKRKDGTIKETPTLRTIKSTKMAEKDDAFKLSSGTPIETIYATHANKLKALANQSRKEYINTPPILQNKEAKEKYAYEIGVLNSKLNVALKNAPLERQALVLANSVVAAKKASNPNMEPDQIKKLKGQALQEARNRTGAHKQRIEITDREWEAIQAGAISNNKLSQILNNTDLDKIKQLATPRTTITVTPAKKQKAELMLANGHTQAEVADALGVSTATLAKMFNN
jgi:DNA-binding CsgD family transcriptional regulator